MMHFCEITANGKSICEGRAKLDKKFNFDSVEPMLFRGTKLLKNVEIKSSGV